MAAIPLGQLCLALCLVRPCSFAAPCAHGQTFAIPVVATPCAYGQTFATACAYGQTFAARCEYGQTLRPCASMAPGARMARRVRMPGSIFRRPHARHYGCKELRHPAICAGVSCGVRGFVEFTKAGVHMFVGWVEGRGGWSVVGGPGARGVGG